MDYIDCTKQKPRRVVLYRGGGQQGVFQGGLQFLSESLLVLDASYDIQILFLVDIIGNELLAVRNGLLEAIEEMGLSEQRDDGTNVVPLITLIVAQNSHGLVLVPEQGGDNAISGTCVDLAMDGIASLNLDDGALQQTLLVHQGQPMFPPSTMSEFDFHLVPHK